MATAPNQNSRAASASYACEQSDTAEKIIGYEDFSVEFVLKTEQSKSVTKGF